MNELWVVKCADAEGTVYTYIFALHKDEVPAVIGADIADGLKMEVIEIMPAENFISDDIYELCTV